MKRIFGFLAMAAAAAALFSCSPKGACIINGNITHPQYETIYMVDIAGAVVDSVSRSSDGDFRFVYDKAESMPQIVMIQFRNKDVSYDRMYLPVALEPGQVEVRINDYINLSGTPLNNEIKDFFDELQELSDSYTQNVATVTSMEVAYSNFYRTKIQENSDNVFGAYLTLAYGRELLPSDLEILKKEASESAE